jgi:type IV secretion system protein VirB2
MVIENSEIGYLHRRKHHCGPQRMLGLQGWPVTEKVPFNSPSRVTDERSRCALDSGLMSVRNNLPPRSHRTAPFPERYGGPRAAALNCPCWRFSWCILARIKLPSPIRLAAPSRLAKSALLVPSLLVLTPLAAHAQGSPFDTGFNAIQGLFTGTIAKVASLVAIVIGGYGFAHGGPGAKKALAGVAPERALPLWQ